jgi:hypothetical protein
LFVVEATKDFLNVSSNLNIKDVRYLGKKAFNKGTNLGKPLFSNNL